MSHLESAIGIDLGGTKLEVALVDSAGNVKIRERIATKVQEGASSIISDIVTLIKKIQSNSNEQILGIGLGTAGQVETITGKVHFSPNLNWVNVPLQAELAKALQLPVIVTNDVRAATWGEWLHGAGVGAEDLICLFIGTGIGGGIISGGHLLTGCSNSAGEVGHMTIELNGPPCTCGNWGCFEALASGWAIAKQAKHAVQQDPAMGKKMLELSGGIDNLSAKIVFEAFQQEDPLAQKIMAKVEEALIAGVAGLVNALNPKKVILGGGIIQGRPEFVPAVREGIKKRALKAAYESVEIVQSKLFGDAGVVGAAALAMRSAFQDGGK